MRPFVTARSALILTLSTALAGCGSLGGDLFKFNRNAAGAEESQVAQRFENTDQSTVWDLFTNARDPSVTVNVNKYLWTASLEVLNFLPVQTVDPFTGVIVTGYGRPPGGGRAYRAAVLINDPALDARSLKLALQYSGGAAVAPDTIRAVEDAIFTRARQLRIQDRGL